MSEKCYIVQFTAHLHKLTLALKMNCQVQIIWKRGQKTCKSGKFLLEGGVALFNKKISINCNMLYNSKAKIFEEKITEFSIVLSSDRGTKQAGRLLFDVAEYVNQKQLNKKDYEVNLEECPDRNAKIFFTLSGVLAKEIEADQISQSSYSDQSISQSPKVEGITNSMIIPSSSSNKKISEKSQSGFSKEKKNASSDSDDKLNRIEEENRRMKQEIKKIDKVKKENEQLRRAIKSEQFKKVREIKEKMEKMKEQIEKMKAEIKANKNMESEIKKNQNQILQCKIKIMKALNFCAQYGGSDLLDSVQNYCGMLEKQ